MKTASAWSTDRDERAAVSQVLSGLREGLGAEPDFILLFGSCLYDTAVLAEAFAASTGATILGGTSRSGVMTDGGFHRDGLGALAISDPEGAYGSALVPKDEKPRAAGALAARRAIEQAGRPGEAPAAVVLVISPGGEEEAILGIESVIGPNIPILGGSSADEAVTGEWSELAGGQSATGSVALAVVYPSTGVATAFHCGYEPTDHRGVVTRADSRVVYEIEGRPAAEVYDEWTGALLDGPSSDVIELTTLHPLGRVVGEIAGVPYHRLSHLVEARDDGSIVVYTDVVEGDEFILMHGTRESIERRAGRVVDNALATERLSANDVLGSFVIFCAGCMSAVADRLDEIRCDISKRSGNAPFVMAFTYGEQGHFLGGENRHGNLMISTLLVSG